MTYPWMPPWTTKTGRDAMTAWIDTALGRLNLSRLAPTTTVLSWELSCVLRVETDDGPLYFKAAAPRLSAPSEARHLISLTTHLPQAPLPRPLIVDDLLGWMIIRDHGTELREVPVLSLWELAAQQYAAVQVASVDQAEALVQSGLIDLRGRRLFAEVPALFRHPHALNALDEDEIDQLRRSSLRLTDRCIWLEEAALPAALVHGDFHAGNTVIHDEHFTFIDWPHASIGLPFLDLTILLHDAARYFDADAVTRLRDAYLDGWSAYGSAGRLRAISSMAQPLGYLHQAIIYNAIADQLDHDAVEPGEARQRTRVAYWLRQMLAALGAA